MCIRDRCICVLTKSYSYRLFFVTFSIRNLNGKLYILTEGGLKFKGIWWNGAISAAVYDSYAGMDSLAGLQMTGTAVYIDPLSDEYRSVIEARGVQLQQLQQMPAMLHAVRLDITRCELLDGALRKDGYAARQVLDLG